MATEPVKPASKRAPRRAPLKPVEGKQQQEGKNLWIFPVVVIAVLLLGLFVFFSSPKVSQPFFGGGTTSASVETKPKVSAFVVEEKKPEVCVPAGEVAKIASSSGVTITQNCNSPTVAPKAPVVAMKKYHHKKTTVAPASSTIVGQTKSNGDEIWLWHHHLATEQKPSLCIIESGEGLGLPPYCKGWKKEPAISGESLEKWRVRVGGGNRPTFTGMYTKQ